MNSFAIIPAAGRSLRMGCAKLLLPWRGGTMIGCQLAAWRASRVTAVFVVCRRDDDALIAECRAGGAVVVPADDPPEMKVSVQLGLRRIEADVAPRSEDVWLLAPGDMPDLSPRLVDRLLAEHDYQQPAILVPTRHGERGHPVLFPWATAALVHELGTNEGVNAVRTRYPTRLLACDDAAILQDLDTPEAYERDRDQSR